jgi:glycogen operon protein
LGTIKLIAEPWDCGPGGYQVGAFPPGWAEWNDRFRDTVRDFWKGSAASSALTEQMCAYGNVFNHLGRRPWACVNFITAHDGFTLNDVVSYNEKHNEANGEENRDGSSDNRSWNCGAEGPTDNPDVNALRERQMRNMLATLLLSQGTPMMLAGDEFGRTQQGNNNAYCQDNEITWINWELTEEQQAWHDFVRSLTRLRRTQPVFQRRKFFQGRAIHGEGIQDISWFEPSGQEMTEEAWNTEYARCLGVRLAGDLIGEMDERGETIVGDTILLLLNAHHEAVPFTLPTTREGELWERLLDTADHQGMPLTCSGGQEYQLQGRAMAVMRIRTPQEEAA